jgi:hypothetical protein
LTEKKQFPLKYTAKKIEKDKTNIEIWQKKLKQLEFEMARTKIKYEN